MQAIQTKYIKATNTKSSRIKAWCDAGSVAINYPHEFNEENAHKHAARALQTRLGWIGKNYGTLVGGGLPNNGGYCFVMVPAVDALGNLVQWAVGNRGAKTGNPYSVPEIDRALMALRDIVGCADHLDSADQWRDTK